MPKAPILDREAFFSVLRDGTIYDLDWNLVNTSIGACVEPRPRSVDASRITNIDRLDAGINRRTRLSEDEFASRMMTHGRLLPADFNVT